MKIEKVNLPEIATSYMGLGPIKMERLGQVVLIAGKNGSGKSRLLKLIKERVQNIINGNSIKQIEEYIEERKRSIANYERNITMATQALKSQNATEADIKNFNANIKSWEGAIRNLNSDINNSQNQLREINYFSLFPEKNEGSVINFVPQSLELTDSYLITQHETDQRAKRIYNIGIENIAEATIPAIDKIQRRWVNANTSSSSDLNITKEEQQKINQDYEKLRKYIKLFLNTELKRSQDGFPELFNKRIGVAKLSNGQIILLQFCIALFAQESKLEDVIIFMDEPENHLHPAALIEVLDKITPHVKNGQIWIATHSIHVLAHFDPSCIWYIDKGEISYAGNVPRKVLAGLLGNEEEIERLSNFLSLPAEMASNQFAFESLFYPDVLITGPEDPQVKQIHEIIQERKTVGDKLQVLDFGIGKGRLLSTIFENERLENRNVADWLDFYGFDKSEEYKSGCLKVLEDIYGSAENRYFNEPKNLLSKHDEKTLDFIIMCNVFHEIQPSEWLNLFTSVTSPFKLLKEDGYLLIVEDQFLAVGEKAHSQGFLVFDELEFKKLFKITSSDKYHSTDYRKDGRLKSHHIPKTCLERIDAKSKEDAIEILYQNAKDEIKKLRTIKSPSFKTGKLHGFWAQQLANASLALEESKSS